MKKSIIYPIFLIILLSLIAIFSIPYISSTKLGQSYLLKYLSQREEKIFFEDLKLTWLGPQNAKNIKIITKKYEIKIASFKTDVSLFQLLKPKKNILDRIIAKNKPTYIRNASLNITYPNYPKAKFSDINLIIQKEENFTKLQANGKSIENNVVGDFNISVKTPINNVQKELIGKIETKNFPIIGIDRFLAKKYFKGQNILSDVFGSKITLKSTFSLKNNFGPVFVDVNSDNATFSINMNYSKESITLKENFIGTIKLTKRLSSVILKDLNPLFVTGLYSENPIVIRFAKDNFYLPIKPYDISKINISHGMIDMGQIVAKRGKTTDSIFSILKRRSKDNQTHIWFTPLRFQIHDGILNTERMDFLINHSYHLCSWGQINLINNKINMTLGLTSQALDEAFGIRSIPDDYVMKIPMRGTTQNVKIDIHEAAAKIAIILAANSANQGLGSFLGSIFSVMDNKNIPPANRPFPWENDKNYRKRSRKKSNYEIFNLLK